MWFTIRLTLTIFILIIVGCFFWFYQNLQISMNIENILIEDKFIKKDNILKVALIGDIIFLILRKSTTNIKNAKNIEKQNPDLIVFAGDYTALPETIANMEEHRSKIVKLLTKNKKHKKIFVLGNYESWSNPEAWINSFREERAHILNNETTQVNIRGENVCIRGLGDFFTKMFQYTDFPVDCKIAMKLTVTHDPAGAFHQNMYGLILAAHTHCGQINFHSLELSGFQAMLH